MRKLNDKNILKIHEQKFAKIDIENQLVLGINIYLLGNQPNTAERREANLNHIWLFLRTNRP